MSTRLLIGGICEQDIDLFLLEEAVSNRSFVTWLLSLLPDWPVDSQELVLANRSVSQGNGESDVELTFADPAGRRAMLLIENKLDAGFQPQQLARYRERATTYVLQGQCAHASVILLAPTSYAHGAKDAVDAVLSYEDVKAWLEAAGPDERFAYKMQLLDTALTKHRLGYNPETDQPVTTFWNLYWREACRLTPLLQLEDPGPKPAGAGFVWFWSARLPEDLNICHKLPKGSVDLQFPGWGRRLYELSDGIGSNLEPGMEIIRAAKSAAIRLAVPVLHTGRPFDEQVESVRLGLAAAQRLYDWANRYRSRIREIVGGGNGRSE
jgi:hypothetical protein